MQGSLWYDTAGEPPPPRPPLTNSIDVDVAIVGAGYTGLWTAYYLAVLDPGLRIVVIDRAVVGFGASGRNGGWCIGEIAAPFESLVDVGGLDAARRQVRALFDTVDEVGKVAAAEGIDCQFAKGGTIRLARNGAQAARQREDVAHAHHRIGLDGDDLRLLDRAEAEAELAATKVLGGMRFAHTAALHPLRLVRGLADAVERRGVTVHESTAVEAIEGGRLVLAGGASVGAEVVVRATEGYTTSLAGHRRTLLPLYSLMVATEPIPADRWADIGLGGRATFADDRHLVIYGQRTADGRIAFGGRGAPYRFGSAIDPTTERDSATHRLIVDTLRQLLPQVADVAVTHRWGGVLGVPRNWFPSVGYDAAAGLAWGGGYVGEGVAAANLAGRTLADLITGTPSERVELPWVGHRSRAWEPEPFRWLGINAALRIMDSADRAEDRTDRRSRRSRLLALLTG